MFSWLTTFATPDETNEKLTLLMQLLRHNIINAEQVYSGHKWASLFKKKSDEGFYRGLKWIEKNGKFILAPSIVTTDEISFGQYYGQEDVSVLGFPETLRPYIVYGYTDSGYYRTISCQKEAPLELLKSLLPASRKVCQVDELAKPSNALDMHNTL